MQPSRRLAALCLFSLLPASFGCRDDGSGPIAYDELVEAQAAVICEYFVECGYATSTELCLDGWSRISTPSVDLDAAVDDGTVRYDAAAAGECLDAIRAASCASFFEGFDEESCDRVFEGTIESGNPCWIDEQCISQSCEVDACAMACCQGTCIAPPPDAGVGEGCFGSGQDCVDGAYCDFETGLCAAEKAAGEACPGGYGCEGGLACISGSCEVPPGEGEPCAELQCAAPFACDIDSGTCQRLRGEGQACNPEASICALGLTCNPSSSTCTAPGGIGSPCAGDFFFGGCAGEAYCAYDFETGEGTCQPRVANGGACDDARACQSDYCGDAGTCEPEPVCVQ
jgi:hypothetical protein